MRTSTRTRHARRIDAAVAHLQQCVERSEMLPDLAALADRACVSAYHFHRVWRASTGEALGRTLTRLRLTRAVQLLVAGRSVTEAALSVGYGSSQALARIFRAELGVTPAVVRGQSDAAAALLARLAPPARLQDGTAPEVEIVATDPFRIVALRHRGSFDALDDSYGRLFGWAETQGPADAIEALVGLPVDDHRDVAPQRLRFVAALRLAAAARPPRPLRMLTVPGGWHARLRHVGPYEALEAATDRLLSDWWAASGIELRAAPLHYHFLDDPEAVAAAALRADILLPLETGAPVRPAARADRMANARVPPAVR
ncbi:AraC family transcriptional regulator [Luteimonas deserti]|uniref:GyrI-like domain-containing protein n=1 Tax=Luteimonas deserti TaxID=2752306 RepID=A0A7Z0TU08_9GAMM|nr:GyrI-like domain-containing protein [Luteimonas deserti]NYZ62361.1 GyrI-like domain-containing protein [Luteimonas deserti]